MFVGCESNGVFIFFDRGDANRAGVGILSHKIVFSSFFRDANLKTLYLANINGFRVVLAKSEIAGMRTGRVLHNSSPVKNLLLQKIRNPVKPLISQDLLVETKRIELSTLRMRTVRSPKWSAKRAPIPHSKNVLIRGGDANHAADKPRAVRMV